MYSYTNIPTWTYVLFLLLLFNYFYCKLICILQNQLEENVEDDYNPSLCIYNNYGHSRRKVSLSTQFWGQTDYRTEHRITKHKLTSDLFSFTEFSMREYIMS